MTPENIFYTDDEEIKQLAVEIRELKELLHDISGKLSRIENRVTHIFPSDASKSSLPIKIYTSVGTVTQPVNSAFLSEEEEIIAMANDPEIQAEMRAINEEFTAAKMDSLE